MKEIIVNAYPKSGITWLIHLLCDLLDSPQQDLPNQPLIWNGTGRGGKFIIRKRHNPYMSEMEGKTVVFIHRDPRDVMISAMHYRSSNNLQVALDKLKTSIYHEINWNGDYIDYINSWRGKATVTTQYRYLHSNPVLELARMYHVLTGEPATNERIMHVIEYNSFDNMSQRMNNPHFFRKGIVGDWRNHFTREIAEKFNNHFGDFLLEYGFEDDPDWWQL